MVLFTVYGHLPPWINRRRRAVSTFFLCENIYDMFHPSHIPSPQCSSSCLVASLEFQDKEQLILSQASQHDIFTTEEEAVAPQRRKIKKNKKTTRKKNRKPWQEDKDRGNKKRKKGRKSKSQSRKACSNQDRIVCDGKGKKVLICLHEDGGIVKTVCMKGKKVPYHLRSHPDDYCGSCTDDDLDLLLSSFSTTSSSSQSYSESKSKKSEVTTIATTTR